MNLRRHVLATACISVTLACNALLAAPASKPAAKAEPRRKIMVPPPPPEIPSLLGLQQHESLLSGVVLDYLSKAELERLKKKLEESLDKDRKAHQEELQSAAEKKDRAEKADAWFADGIISKKELQTTKKEAVQAEKEVSELKSKISDQENDLNRVCRQLDKLKKRDSKPLSKGLQTTVKKKKYHGDGLSSTSVA